MTTPNIFYFIVRSLLKYSVFITVLLTALMSSAHANDLLIAQISASKQFDNGYKVIAAGGNIYERYKGRFSYLGVNRATDSGRQWQLGYFGYYPQKDGGGYRRDDRIRGSVTYKFNLDGWQFSHRSRLEYRRGEIIKGFRYRPAFELSHPLSFNKVSLIPYAELEPFYDFRKDKVTLVLFTAGVKWPITRSLIATASHFNILTTEDSIHTKGALLGLHIVL